MGTYNSVNGPAQNTTTAMVSRFYQRLFGTFVRDPTNGLRKEYNWPVYDPSKTTLLELFRNNTVTAQLHDPASYDEICQNPPPLPLADLVGPPPSC
jgi:hypothetical protein